MTNLVEILETLGKTSDLSNESEIKTFLESSKLDEETINAILTKNEEQLAHQLDVCPDIVCLLVPAEDDEDSEGDSEEQEESSIKLVINA